MFGMNSYRAVFAQVIMHAPAGVPLINGAPSGQSSLSGAGADRRTAFVSQEALLPVVLWLSNRAASASWVQHN